MNPATRTHPLDDEAIDGIWMAAAAEVGLRVERTTEAYASTDGRGLLTIGAPETLDPDDSLAQLVLHELCHALVQGPENLRAVDWGLDNTTERDLPNEQGCLRLQAHLADRHALRGLLAPTTVVRPYYDALPPFPLEGSDPAAALARRAAGRAAQPPWAAALERALAATAERVVASGRFAAGSGHPLGGPITPGACGGCAWAYLDRAGELRCRQRGGPDGNGHRVDARWPACLGWERPLDCRSCAACCREGFDRVTVGVREEVVWRHPALVVRGGPRFELARAGARCAALEQAGERFGCAIYEDRPAACRQVVPGDARCLAARRRVGLGPAAVAAHG